MKIFLTLFLLVSNFFAFAQNTGSGLIVYHVKGSVQLKDKKNNLQLKPYQELQPGSELIFGKDSKLSLIVQKDRSIYNFSENGTCKLSKLLSKINSASSTLKNVSGLIIDKFIEKGKVMHGEKKIVGRGWVTRGESVNPFAFPADSTAIFSQSTFIPLFEDKSIDKSVIIKSIVSRNGVVLSRQKINSGDSIVINDHPESGFDLELSLKNQAYNFTFIPLSLEKRKNIQSALQEIDAAQSSSPSESLLTKAILFESNACYIEALDAYDQLVATDPKNETYSRLRAVFLQMIK